jgi:tRNA-(ms[2]io[6]A)-hydroxylase
LPLLCPTPAGWAPLAAAHLDLFLADHAVCEQQAALTALNLVAHYPDDPELVERMTALAAEEVLHLRRVSAILHGRGLHVGRRRPNAFVRGLHSRVARDREPQLKIDRLLVGALIEARSCERFTCLLEEIGDADSQVASLLAELGPAERRHWEMFFGLAGREAAPDWLAEHWRGWLEFESRLTSESGRLPTVHG